MSTTIISAKTKTVVQIDEENNMVLLNAINPDGEIIKKVRFFGKMSDMALNLIEKESDRSFLPFGQDALLNIKRACIH